MQPRHLTSRRLQTGFAGRTGFPGVTVGTIHQIPSTAAWVRARYVNYFEAVCTVDAAAFSPTSETGNGMDCYDETGAVSTAGWCRFTFGNGGRDVPLVTQIAGPEREPAVTLEIPGQPGQSAEQVVAEYLSDWMRLPLLSRRDGGREALLNCRTYSAGQHVAFDNIGNVGLPGSDFPILSQGYYLNGNAAAAPFTTPQGGEPFRNAAPHTLDFVCTQAGFTIMAVGDSILQGSYTTGDVFACGALAAGSLATAQHFVSYVSCATGRQSTLATFANAHRQIASVRPHIVVMQAWSQNDPATQDAAADAWARTIALAAFAAEHGAVVVLCTAAPVFRDDAASETVRGWSNQQVRDSGFAVLDIDRLLGTGGSPNGYRPGFVAADGTHPNDAAQRYLSEDLVALCRKLIDTGN